MKPKISNFGRELKENLGRANTGCGEGRLRPTTHILYAIIAIYCFVCICGMGIGVLFDEHIITLIDSPELAQILADRAIWLPIAIVGFIILMGLWAVLILFNAVVASKQNRTASGTVVGGEIRSYYDTDYGDMYYIHCTVAFEVLGEIYRSSGRLRYDSSDRAEVEAKLRKIVPGTKVDVFYDAKNPHSITLERMDTDIRGEFFSGIGFIIGGFAGSVFLGALLTGFIT